MIVESLPKLDRQRWLSSFLLVANQQKNQMKILTTVIAIILIAFTARASEPVPYIAMPIDDGYAIDLMANANRTHCVRVT